MSEEATKTTSLHADFKWRGLIHQVTDERLFAHLARRKLTLYCGFDPTADSLHIGSLLPLITLKRLQKYGHKVIALMGGATGMIGDPSGKSAERNLLARSNIEDNVKALTASITRILADDANPAVVVDNWNWFTGVEYIPFLRDIGKLFSVNAMIAKESVKQRLETREQGISYTEFSYALLQSYDFYQLYRQHDCVLQIGGSDQWGNITSGAELIRRLVHLAGAKKKEVYGLTLPLLVKDDGSKFGKTEKGNIWLDPAKTSAYDFYQFFLRISDAEALTLLKYLTFITPAEYTEIAEITARQPDAREAHKLLATSLTSLIHGEEELAQVEKASASLFTAETEIKNLDAKSLAAMFAAAPESSRAKSELVQGVSLLKLLVDTGLCSSKGQAKKDVAGGGIYVNADRVTDIKAVLTSVHLLADTYIILRRGKKNHHLLRFV